MNNSRLLLVKSRLKTELSNIIRLYDELDKRNLLINTPDRKNNLTDQFILRATGSILHDFYTSVESMFKIVARYIDESVPDNPEWHIVNIPMRRSRSSGVA